MCATFAFKFRICRRAMEWVKEKEEWLVAWDDARCLKEITFQQPQGSRSAPTSADTTDVFFSDVIEAGDRCIVCRAQGCTVDIFDLSPTAEALLSWKVHLPSPVVRDIGVSHALSDGGTLSLVFLTSALVIHQVQVLLHLDILEVVVRIPQARQSCAHGLVRVRVVMSDCAVRSGTPRVQRQGSPECHAGNLCRLCHLCAMLFLVPRVSCEPQVGRTEIHVHTCGNVQYSSGKRDMLSHLFPSESAVFRRIPQADSCHGCQAACTFIMTLSVCCVSLMVASTLRTMLKDLPNIVGQTEHVSCVLRR